MNQQTPKINPSPHYPIAIGGVGGSGTRLVCGFLKRLGFEMGGDLNESADNLWFTLLFRYPGILSAPKGDVLRLFGLFKRRMLGDTSLSAAEHSELRKLSERQCPHHSNEFLAARIESWIDTSVAPSSVPERWGWKEPNTHIVLDTLLRAEPQLRYIHVIRNGLDMALSPNQNQAELWSEALLGRPFDGTAAASLEFWCAATKRTLITAALLADRVFVLNFEALCAQPEPQLQQLYAWLNVSPTDPEHASMLASIKPLTSVGRFREVSVSQFANEDVSYVQSLGFDVT